MKARLAQLVGSEADAQAARNLAREYLQARILDTLQRASGSAGDIPPGVDHVVATGVATGDVAAEARKIADVSVSTLGPQSLINTGVDYSK
ncbi:MAG: hypothetical protein FJZ01_03490 [Candidatus Sericytochromatia bacterium]|nr:hypothetical protein [Candidatus Tanganyikabacteria bacterium]